MTDEVTNTILRQAVAEILSDVADDLNDDDLNEVIPEDAILIYSYISKAGERRLGHTVVSPVQYHVVVGMLETTKVELLDEMMETWSDRE